MPDQFIGGGAFFIRADLARLFDEQFGLFLIVTFCASFLSRYRTALLAPERAAFQSTQMPNILSYFPKHMMRIGD
ncbi:MAG: hypothetical protein ABSD08_18585 [Xanthobacteraceae bacterium]|jgi:hypothetical protein